MKSKSDILAEIQRLNNIKKEAITPFKSYIYEYLINELYWVVDYDMRDMPDKTS